MSFLGWISIVLGVACVVLFSLLKRARERLSTEKSTGAQLEQSLKERSAELEDTRNRHHAAIQKAKERANECTADMEIAFKAGIAGPEAARSALIDYVDSVFSASPKNRNEDGSTD